MVHTVQNVSVEVYRRVTDGSHCTECQCSSVQESDR